MVLDFEFQTCPVNSTIFLISIEQHCAFTASKLSVFQINQAPNPWQFNWAFQMLPPF